MGAVALNAIGNAAFAFARIFAATQKERAFQASSPKTSKPSFGAAFFLFLAAGRTMNGILTMSD